MGRSVDEEEFVAVEEHPANGRKPMFASEGTEARQLRGAGRALMAVGEGRPDLRFTCSAQLFQPQGKLLA